MTKKTITLKVSPNYRIDHKKPQVIYKMIDSTNDVLRILKSKPEENVNLILRDNDLTGFVYELLDLGYAPLIEYKAGKISTILMSFNKN